VEHVGSVIFYCWLDRKLMFEKEAEGRDLDSVTGKDNMVEFGDESDEGRDSHKIECYIRGCINES
jgi:hypothetical protein